jgi:hypothetical protein
MRRAADFLNAFVYLQKARPMGAGSKRQERYMSL